MQAHINIKIVKEHTLGLYIIVGWAVPKRLRGLPALGTWSCVIMPTQRVLFHEIHDFGCRTAVVMIYGVAAGNGKPGKDYEMISTVHCTMIYSNNALLCL
jgi:hypothetical protein